MSSSFSLGTCLFHGRIQRLFKTALFLPYALPAPSHSGVLVFC